MKNIFSPNFVLKMLNKWMNNATLSLPSHCGEENSSLCQQYVSTREGLLYLTSFSRCGQNICKKALAEPLK